MVRTGTLSNNLKRAFEVLEVEGNDLAKENHQATFNSTTVTCKLNKCLDVSYVKIKTKIDTNIKYNTKPQFSKEKNNNKKKESKKNKLSQNFALINLYWIGNKLS